MARVTRVLVSFALAGIGLAAQGCASDHDHHYAHDDDRYDRHERQSYRSPRSGDREARRAREARLEAERELARARSAAEEAEDAALDASLAQAAVDPLAPRRARRAAPAQAATTWYDDETQATATWGPTQGPQVVVTRVTRVEDVPACEPWDCEPVAARRVYSLPTCEPVAVESTYCDPWTTRRQTTRGTYVSDPWSRQTLSHTQVIVGPTTSTCAPAAPARVIYRRPARTTVYTAPACEPLPVCEPVYPTRRSSVCAPTPVVVVQPRYAPRRATYVPQPVCAPTYAPPVCAPTYAPPVCAPTYAARRAPAPSFGLSVTVGRSSSRCNDWNNNGSRGWNNNSSRGNWNNNSSRGWNNNNSSRGNSWNNNGSRGGWNNNNSSRGGCNNDSSRGGSRGWSGRGGTSIQIGGGISFGGRW